MDFGFNDEQQAIKETAREMLAKRSPLSKVREAAESRSYDDALWKELCELGWPGIAIAEDHDGQGLAMVELTILCEELGYACAATRSSGSMASSPPRSAALARRCPS